MHATKILEDGLSAKMIEFAEHFSASLQEVLGNKLYSIYLYGAALFPHPPKWRLDFDYHVVLAEPLSATEIANVKALYKRLEASRPFGKEIDGYCVLLADARRRESPHDAVWPDNTDTSWALHRAHIHAGRFNLLYGENPTTFEPIPEWSELEAGLQNEFAFIREHPQYPQFGILNLCRILYSRQQHDVVVSKYASAEWALAHLNGKWRPAIRAAVRDYEGKPICGDRELLEKIFPDFLAFGMADIEGLRS